MHTSNDNEMKGSESERKEMTTSPRSTIKIQMRLYGCMEIVKEGRPRAERKRGGCRCTTIISKTEGSEIDNICEL